MISAGDRPEHLLNRALLLLAPAITIVVASEFIVVGLLPLVSQDLRIPLAKAGELAGWWAFSAAVAGPFVTLLASRMAPRVTLIATLLLFTLGNAVVAFTYDFNIMLAARAVQGAMLPAFVSVGASVVTRLAHPSEQGKKLARANIGFVLGVILALPASVVLAQGGAWRLPFIVLAVASLPMALLVALFFPRLTENKTAGIGGQLGLLRQPLFLAHLALSAMLFSGMFAAYTYLGAWIEQAFGLPGWLMALVLFLYGAAGLAGNTIAGRFADSAPVRATLATMLILVAAINLTALSGASLLLAVLPLAIWSISHTASVTLCQVRVTLAGKDAPSFAMTLNISAANLGIAIGTVGGGWVIDSQGIGAIGIAPIGFAIVALPLIMLIGRDATSRQPVPTAPGRT
ncbi:MFS transporter [Rhizobium lentis]|uniref:MFS transporter n=1 Tax=Rhizobium lentis TaxID=1138194 RepID=UPI001C8392CB|nr:MFS transporter [Rhizobium lentis]MBX5041210.1 MFS transporter [Rhizobium lentis]MBX5051909.1 MFS transporter [Rhizobium lentis]MBX5071467.1 MFS transporter [Rhizobium lentis]MBX5108495.1 MFS transporter [Rhizobium lentis]MBX5117825.1 MFS transporter [Rhizobium lentis]